MSETDVKLNWTHFIVPVFFVFCVVYTIVGFFTGHILFALALGGMTTFNIVMKVREIKALNKAEKAKELR